jgi:DNA-binding transcriptional ArsR family regulator
MKVSALDPLLGTPARLAVMATLADGRDWTFTELREATGLADGNLHVQTAKLAEGGYLRIRKVKRDGRTATCFRAEDEGLEALRRQVEKLQRALDGERPAKPAGRKPAGGKPAGSSRVW